MKTSRLLRLIVPAVLMSALIVPAMAKGKKKATPAPTPHAIVISSISGNNITITDDTSTKTVTATQFTEIIVNGQKATFADLKPGMTVNLVLSSPTQASRITATTK